MWAAGAGEKMKNPWPARINAIQGSYGENRSSLGAGPVPGRRGTCRAAGHGDHRRRPRPHHARHCRSHPGRGSDRGKRATSSSSKKGVPCWQVETADGSALSFASRAQALLPAAGPGGKPGDLLLAAGWVKLNLATAAQVPTLATAQGTPGGAKRRLRGNRWRRGTQLFSESGDLVPVFAATRAGQPAVIKGGDFVAIRVDAGASTARRAPPTLSRRCPRFISTACRCAWPASRPAGCR